jgi:hypothetical protein
MKNCWVLLKRGGRSGFYRGSGRGLLPGLIVLLAFKSEQEARDYAEDVLGLGVLGYQARNLETWPEERQTA